MSGALGPALVTGASSGLALARTPTPSPAVATR